MQVFSCGNCGTIPQNMIENRRTIVGIVDKVRKVIDWKPPSSKQSGITNARYIIF